MKKDIMIMYSGGVESTALVVHALKQEHNITLIHVIHNNKSQKEHRACRGTSYKHFGNLPVLAITIQKNNFDLKYGHQHRDVSIWFAVAMMIAGRGAWDEVWYGTHNKDNQDKIPNMEKAWDAMMDIIERKTKIISPLRNKSKLDQYNMLTPEVKECIISCAVIADGARNEPCGECMKCQEFKQLVTNRL